MRAPVFSSLHVALYLFLCPAVSALPAAVAVQETGERAARADAAPSEAALREAIEEQMGRVREATPRGGRTPAELLEQAADLFEKYWRYYPDTDYAPMARGMFLSCAGRMDAPERVLAATDHWLARHKLGPQELDRALRARLHAIEQMEGAEAAAGTAARDLARFRSLHVRMLLLDAERQAEPEAQAERFAQALAAAGDDDELAADALAARGLAMLERASMEEIPKIEEILEHAQARNAEAPRARTLAARLRMHTRRARAEAEAGGPVAPGRPAPSFALPDVFTGETVKLEDLRGDLVLVDFWATWCGPCHRLSDILLVELHQEYKDKGLVILGVGTNWRGETAEVQRNWALAKEEPLHRGSTHTRGQADWPKVFDADGSVTDTYGVRGIPHVVLVDRDGTVLLAGSGHQLAPQIRSLLRERLGG